MIQKIDKYGNISGNGTIEIIDKNGNVKTSSVKSITATSPLFSSGGIIPNLTIQQSSNSQDGYLSFTDWTIFNSKEPAISFGTTSQYWRGDKTWQTFPNIPSITPSALTKVDDTNITLTLGGAPNTALLESVSLALGWTGTLADSRITSANTWNAKQDAISLTTTGSSGAATFIGNILNIPQYTDQYTGTVTSVTAISPIISSEGTAPIISTYMSTNKLIGRGSNGSGIMEEITIGSGLSLLGTTLNATAALLQYANYSLFPTTGSTSSEYLDLSTNITYYWDGFSYKKLNAFTSDFQVSLPGGKTLGKYVSGSIVPANGLTAKEVLLLASVEAIPPTLTLTSSTTIAFNQTTINNVLNFTKTINSLGATINTLSLEWRRNNTGSWIVLTTNTALTTYTHSMTDSANNAQPFNYKLIVTDTSGGTSTVILDIIPLSYIAPTAALSLNITPTITLNKMLRSLSTATSVIISGTITRNSSNVNLTQYKIQKSYNNSAWSDLITLRSINSSGGTLAANGGNVTDNAQPIDQNNVYYRAFVIDTYNTSGLGVNATASFGIYQPVLFGMTTITNPASVLLASLTPVPIGSSNTNGQCNYQNTSSDKTINGLSFTPSTNRFCIAFDNSYGTLSTFFDTGSNLNLINNFTSATQSVTFLDGTVKTYKVYLYNLVVSSGTYIINIS